MEETGYVYKISDTNFSSIIANILSLNPKNLADKVAFAVIAS